MADSMVITDRWRTPITVRRREDERGGIILSPAHGAPMYLSVTEIQRPLSFVHGLGTLQRYAPENE